MKNIFLIGAGRSGTNLLANALSSCEYVHNLGELRHVWSYAQKNKKIDYIDPRLVPSYSSKRIERYFFRMHQKYPSKNIFIDKTTANALRIPFVNSLFDDALFIHVIRDVRDNLLSRIVQYNGGSSLHQISANPVAYLKRLTAVLNNYNTFKVLVANKNIPYSRVPSALIYSALPRLLHLIGFPMPVWGERTAGYSSYYKNLGRDIALVSQWRDVVNQARFDGSLLPSGQYLEVRFEDLLENPAFQIERINKVLPEIDPIPAINYLQSNIISSNKNKWRDVLDDASLNKIGPFVRTTLEAFGYDW